MAHECHAHFLQDTGLHQARVERMAEIVETCVADTGVLQCGIPRALHDADGLAAKLDHQAFGLAVLTEELA